MTTLTAISTEQEIIDFLKEGIYSIIDVHPPGSLHIDIDTDLADTLKDDEFDELLDYIEESFGFDSGDFFIDETDDPNYWKKVKNIVREILLFSEELEDGELMHAFHEEPGEKPKEDKQFQEVFSFTSAAHKEYIAKIKKHAPTDFLSNNNLIKAASGLVRDTGQLMNIFWEYDYLPSATIDDEEEIVQSCLKILHDIYKIFAEVNLEKHIESKQVPSCIKIGFNYPKKIKYLNDIDGCAQLLSIISSDILDDICKNAKVDEISVINSLSKCLAIIGTIAESCGKTLDELVDMNK